MSEKLVYSEWSNNIYPCGRCAYLGPLDAFEWGECYDPCPKCGADLPDFGKTGRYVYRVETYLLVFKQKIFLRVEWKTDDQFKSEMHLKQNNHE